MPHLKSLAAAIRFLSIDAVEKAKSGHPGMPLGMADIATVLWLKFMKHNPKNPMWFNRDRFVLSNGHGSMLLYALLYLTGYDVSIEDLQQFRQLHSKTPGHPECLETPGVETTTGPLGQGLANAVGMAIAEQHLAAKFNQGNIDIINHFTYAFVGDGCLMEGISHEVCSFAGTLKLGKLIVFYDANHISIDGDIDHWFTDDTATRFRAYDWHVVDTIDGHDFDAIEKAILEAQAVRDKPSLIICRTVIGYGSTAAGTAAVHGAPLGPEDIEQLRLRLDWPYPAFEVPQEIKEAWRSQTKGIQLEEQWLAALEAYQAKHPALYETLLRTANGDLPDGWTHMTAEFIASCKQDTRDLATRKASFECIGAYAKCLPELLGGSADLTPSNNTRWQAALELSSSYFEGNYIHYGVREFGMSAIMNGLALHGGVIPFGGTFLVFSDYARPAIRLAALMKTRVIFVYSHDSIGVGEDGPTHQPIEHLPMLRMTPELDVWRPADLFETAIAWQQALMKKGPSCILLTRQNVKALVHDTHTIEQVREGGYIVQDSHENQAVNIVFIATGSEVQLAIQAQAELLKTHPLVNIRVVSMPCVERFLSLSLAKRAAILPRDTFKVAIEAAAGAPWYQLVGDTGAVIGLDSFGLSAPGEAVFDALGITVEKIKATVYTFLEKENHEKTYCD